MDGPLATIRTDPAPGFQALCNDSSLHDARLQIELGQAKNKNKNPVAERAIQELQEELMRQDPTGNPVSPHSLARATANLNAKLRQLGLSAREIILQRDQFTGSQLPICDDDIINAKQSSRSQNAPASAKSKVPNYKPAVLPDINVGDLVYIRQDRSKHQARSRYLVVVVDQEWCSVRKFVGTQLRQRSYRVRLSDCLRVPDQTPAITADCPGDISDEDTDEIEAPSHTMQQPPPPVPEPANIPRDLYQSPYPEDVSLPNELDLNFPAPPEELPPFSTPTAPSVTSPPRRSMRERKPNVRFKDYVVYNSVVMKM